MNRFKCVLVKRSSKAVFMLLSPQKWKFRFSQDRIFAFISSFWTWKKYYNEKIFKMNRWKYIFVIIFDFRKTVFLIQKSEIKNLKLKIRKWIALNAFLLLLPLFCHKTINLHVLLFPRSSKFYIERYTKNESLQMRFWNCFR